MKHHGPRHRAGWILPLLALLGGCASEAPSFQPVSPIPAGKGVVYVYRPAGPEADAGEPALVSANNIAVARLAAGDYFAYVGRPGAMALQTGQAATTVGYANVDAGVEKYLRGGDYAGRLKFAPVSPATGRREIAGCAPAAIIPRAAGTAPAAGRPPASAAKPVAAAQRRRTGTSPPSKVLPGDSPAGRHQGPLSFEAERVALEQGCTTRDGVRPVALLTFRGDEGRQVYEVACIDRRVRVECQFAYCEPLGR